MTSISIRRQANLSLLVSVVIFIALISYQMKFLSNTAPQLPPEFDVPEAETSIRSKMVEPQPPSMQKSMSVFEMDALTTQILGPDNFGSGCPPGCGCKNQRKDCPQHYSIEDVQRSADAILDVASALNYAHRLEQQHVAAMQKCAMSDMEGINGGYCLSRRPIEHTLKLWDGRAINIPKGHVLPSEQIGLTMTKLFEAENVCSVADFGAGVGQYGVYLKESMPELIYTAYDGAGDVESYTNGLVKYADFTLPLDFPVAEWVLSLEVGEHIPSKYEGIFVRNIHRHNCKGVILSWGVLGQHGENHINLHSNEYVSRIFDQLGYYRDYLLEEKFRFENIYKYFQKSVMVFRRRQATCGELHQYQPSGSIPTPHVPEPSRDSAATALKKNAETKLLESQLDLFDAPAADRDLKGVTVDLAYTLNVPYNWWEGMNTSPSYNTLMMSLHGKNIWNDEKLPSHLDSLGIKGVTKDIFGSPLRGSIEELLRKYQPKIFLEVGVFRGATSTKIAKFFKDNKGFEDSYVLSMDTWLLDLYFAWNGVKSTHRSEVINEEEYFVTNKVAGGNQMYFQFLANCIASNTTDRIIPIQTASLNGVVALLSHGVRPDFIYIDASHANPDVFLDYENFYKVLNPGGVLAFDDVASVPATRAAFDRLANRYGLKQNFMDGTKKQGFIIKEVHDDDGDGGKDNKTDNANAAHGAESPLIPLWGASN